MPNYRIMLVFSHLNFVLFLISCYHFILYAHLFAPKHSRLYP